MQEISVLYSKAECPQIYLQQMVILKLTGFNSEYQDVTGRLQMVV